MKLKNTGLPTQQELMDAFIKDKLKEKEQDTILSTSQSKKL